MKLHGAHKSRFPWRLAIALLAISSVLSISNPAGAKTIAQLTAEGNRLYSEGRYGKALEVYRQAKSLGVTAELLFNEGDAFFKTGNYKAAARQYRMAALSTNDRFLRSKCFFNLASASFRQAEATRAKDPKEAAELYASSARDYLEAYRLDPGLKQAGQNLEQVRIILGSFPKRTAAETKRRPQEGKMSQAQTPNRQAGRPASTSKHAGKPEPKGKNTSGGQKTRPPSERLKAGETINSSGIQTGARKDSSPSQDNPAAIFREERENRAHTAKSTRFGVKAVERDW